MIIYIFNKLKLYCLLKMYRNSRNLKNRNAKHIKLKTNKQSRVHKRSLNKKSKPRSKTKSKQHSKKHSKIKTKSKHAKNKSRKYVKKSKSKSKRKYKFENVVNQSNDFFRQLKVGTTNIYDLLEEIIISWKKGSLVNRLDDFYLEGSYVKYVNELTKGKQPEPISDIDFHEFVVRYQNPTFASWKISRF